MPFRIAGEYLDENGDPIAGATVIANIRSSGGVAGIVTTDVNGEFELDPLPEEAEGELLYVSVFQDGFVPQVFDQIDPEFYEAPASGPELLVISNAENAIDFEGALNFDARLYSRSSYSADEGETWTLETLLPQFAELVGDPILITGAWGVGVTSVDVGPITVPEGLDEKNLMVVGMMLHDEGNRYNTDIYIGSNNFDESENSISVARTLIVASPAPSPNPRALLRSHVGRTDVPEDGQVRVVRAGTLDGAVNFRIWLQFVNYADANGGSENALGEPGGSASLPADLTPSWTMENFFNRSGGVGFMVIGRENQDDDLGGETVSTNSTTPYVELVAPDTWESGFFPGWGARMFASPNQTAADADVPETVELNWGAANASENGGVDNYRVPPVGLDSSHCVTWVDRHDTFIVGREGRNGDPIRRTADGETWTAVPNLPDGQYITIKDVPEWNLTFVSLNDDGGIPEGAIFFSTDLVTWINPTTVTAPFAGAGVITDGFAYGDDTLIGLSISGIGWLYTTDQGVTWDEITHGYGPEDFFEEAGGSAVEHMTDIGFVIGLQAFRHYVFSADGEAFEFRRYADDSINFFVTDMKHVPFLGLTMAIGWDNDTGEPIIAWSANLSEDSWTVLVDTVPYNEDIGFESFKIAVLSDSVVMVGGYGTVVKSSDLVTWVEKTNDGLPWSGIAGRPGTFGPAPVFPAITSIDPDTVDEDTGAVTVTITGTNFSPTDDATFGGAARTTNYVSATEIEIELLAGDVVDPGTFSIRVQTAGLVYSNSVSFEVVDVPTPTIESIDPNSVEEDLGPETIIITGTGFLAESVARFEGAARTTTFNSSTELEVELLAADTETVGTFQIDVENPTTAEISNEADLEVTATPPAAPVINLTNHSIVGDGNDSISLAFNNGFAGQTTYGFVEEGINGVYSSANYDDEFLVGWQDGDFPSISIGSDYEIRFETLSGTLDQVPMDSGFTPLPENTWSYNEWSGLTLYDAGGSWFGVFTGPIFGQNSTASCTIRIDIRRVDMTGPVESAEFTLTR